MRHITMTIPAVAAVVLSAAVLALSAEEAIRLVSGVKLGRDAFRFRTAGDDFLIEGDDDRSVLFGVYDFLENQCGCDWLTSDQEIVPSRKVFSSEHSRLRGVGARAKPRLGRNLALTTRPTSLPALKRQHDTTSPCVPQAENGLWRLYVYTYFSRLQLTKRQGGGV